MRETTPTERAELAAEIGRRRNRKGRVVGDGWINTDAELIGLYYQYVYHEALITLDDYPDAEKLAAMAADLSVRQFEYNLPAMRILYRRRYSQR